MGHPVAALILPLYYLADSGITIMRRVLRREKIWQAHRQHFYQRATVSMGSPAPVVRWIALTNLALIFAALLDFLFPLAGMGLAVLIVILLLVKMNRCAKKALPL